MSKTCVECDKNAYITETTAIAVALICSRRRATALRVYRCPFHPTWHLTRRRSWHGSGDTRPPGRGDIGLRRLLAATIAKRTVVHEAELIRIAATQANDPYPARVVRTIIDAWYRSGLVYPDGPMVTAVDLLGLREIAERGWNAWLDSQASDRSAA